jgi:hypothetical protein
MTKEEAAAKLNGNEYRSEGSSELWATMKSAGLVAVFGASDDLMEFNGAIYDEIGAYDGGVAYVNAKGRASEEEIYGGSAKITAIWGGSPVWRIETSIPHAAFTITEDGEPFCRGIVFALADVAASIPAPVNESDPLYALCRAFIAKHEIICAEATAEDRVYVNAPDLVEEICKIVGYAPNPDL